MKHAVCSLDKSFKVYTLEITERGVINLETMCLVMVLIKKSGDETLLEDMARIFPLRMMMTLAMFWSFPRMEIECK